MLTPTDNNLLRRKLGLFPDNLSEQSKSTKEKMQDLRDDAVEMIKKFASGYDSSGFKTTVDSFSNTIKSVQLLSGYSATTHKEEEVGRRLYEDLDTVVKIIGKEFNHVIEINYDLESFRAECIEKRASLDRRIKEAKTISAMILLEPRKDRIVFKHNNVMDAQIEELLQDEELSQAAREEKTLKIKFNNERAILTEYFKLVDAYDESVGKKNKAIVELSEYNSEYDKIHMEERTSSLFLECSLQLVNKVRDVMTKHPNIQSVLKGTVIVRSTNEQLCNPLESNNLTGVMEILYDRYQRKTFVSFTINLMDILGWSLSDDDSLQNPAKGVTEVQQMLSRWRNREMEKELTTDNLFTALLIKGLSPKATLLRTTLLTETHKFLMSGLEESSASELPVFNFVCQHIIQHQSTLQYANRMKKGTTSAPTTTTSSGGGYNKYNNPNYKGKDLVEAAADAHEHSLQEANAVKETPQQLFKHEVIRDKGIKYTHPTTSQTHPYVAVWKKHTLCATCYPETGEGTACGKDGENKKCYAIMCTKCNMYGHPKAGCKQIVNAKA